MPSIIVFNKPFQVLSQFTTDEEKATLSSFIDKANFYPAGRLDYDSEGLLLLTDHGALQHLIASPQHKMPKTYLVQVEGELTKEAVEQLRVGVELKDGLTKPAEAKIASDFEPWPRHPPIRERKNIPTSWLELTITEGKNRQVRRMTAAVGFPTLRLIRTQIGPYSLTDIELGHWLEKPIDEMLAMELEKFEKNRARQKPRGTSSNNRRRSHSAKNKLSRSPVSNGQRKKTGQAGTQPTRRTR
ncbi:Pseudouridine synthase, Rsu [Marinomonas sp. MED121]|uniref:pseudouridine synthase n=1 Tax=Marinomonas sp. MED121 TaxID=314277 RepID=UPI000068FC12|nr:pseudouridine synthase [Marinomonas sp. MED121]EAQ63822.1 Pseudouridine synthase, Rsu [Marinomonas sp. MED121]